MAIYKQSIDLLPRLSEEEIVEKAKLSRTGLYAAVLPLLASLIWVIATSISGYYRNEVRKLDDTITQKESEITSYESIRQKQTELVLKVEALEDLVTKDFCPQKFFNDVSQTIRSTGDAQAEIYAYTRDDDGTFGIQGKANSYLDLAKIMVVFNNKDEFENVGIESIRYDKEVDNVNFEISFEYAELEAGLYRSENETSSFEGLFVTVV